MVELYDRAKLLEEVWSDAIAGKLAPTGIFGEHTIGEHRRNGGSEPARDGDCEGATAFNQKQAMS